MISIMIPEIARVTREQVIKKVLTSAAVGAAFDGAIALLQERNPAKDIAKGGIVGAIGQAASIVARERFNTSDKVTLGVGVAASVIARHALKDKPKNDNSEPEED